MQIQNLVDAVQVANSGSLLFSNLLQSYTIFSQDRRAKDFQANIQKYNNALAMTVRATAVGRDAERNAVLAGDPK